MLNDKTILLIISGGIAAYKALELLRLLKKSGAQVRGILTSGGQQFITPLSVAALSEEPCHTDLFSLKDETEMGHIRLTREADAIIIAPASANILAKMAHGLADDLATTCLLATDRNTPIFIAPSMNPDMWANPATQDNIALLEQRGIKRIGPNNGMAACGETGTGRLAEPEEILKFIEGEIAKTSKHPNIQESRPLNGLKALVTAGPTNEPIDPVRFIGNRSSGKQGYAIAEALRDAGADVTLITGPTTLPSPDHINTIQIETASEMFDAAQNALPAAIAVCTAAVGDFAPAFPAQAKIKKQKNKQPQPIELKKNKDILQTLSHPDAHRPALVIGFAAETENLLENARQKRAKKGCDWLLANDVAAENIFGSDENHVYLVTDQNTEEWPRMSKRAVAQTLVEQIIRHFDQNNGTKNNGNHHSQIDAA